MRIFLKTYAHFFENSCAFYFLKHTCVTIKFALFFKAP